MAKDKEQVRDAFRLACEDYVALLCEAWDISDGYWACDDIGGLYCFNDTECISMDNIRLCVDKGVLLSEYMNWSEYCTFAHEFNQNSINLRSWHMGYHGLPKESQARLRSLRREFEEEVKRLRTEY